MELLKRYKKILLFAGIFLALFFGYTFFFAGSSPEDDALLVADGSGAGSDVGRELVTILIQLQSLKTDPSVLKAPAFQSLQDFGQEIPLEPIGRSNPFIPI